MSRGAAFAVVCGGLQLLLGTVILIAMNLSVEAEQEEDGRWIAEVVRLPGVLAYGVSRQEAIARAKALALRVLADQLEHGEMPPELEEVFSVAV